jgi:hypothetical protein
VEAWTIKHRRCGLAIWVKRNALASVLLKPDRPACLFGLPCRQHDSSLSAVAQGEGVANLSGQNSARSFWKSGAKVGGAPIHQLRRSSSLERVVLWVSRLALPAITYLLGQVLYWLWFDNLDVDNHVGVLIGGLSLSVVLLLVLVLTLTSWCFGER